MAEGKLTLPALYALNQTKDPEMIALANHVKHHTTNQDEIMRLVAFAKENGGIAYAEKKMKEWHEEGSLFIEQYVKDEEISRSLQAYLDFVSLRNY